MLGFIISQSLLAKQPSQQEAKVQALPACVFQGKKCCEKYKKKGKKRCKSCPKR